MLDLFDQDDESREHLLNELETLELNHKQLKNEAARASVKHRIDVVRDKLSCLEKPGFKGKPLEVFWFGVEHHQMLRQRCLRLQLDKDWLAKRLEQNSVIAHYDSGGRCIKIENFHRDVFFSLNEQLYDIEFHINQHVDPTFKPGGKPDMDLFGDIVAEATNEDGEVQLPPPPEVPKEEAPKSESKSGDHQESTISMDNTAATTAGTSSTGALGTASNSPVDREAILDELRRELGYGHEPISVRDKDHAAKLLRLRWTILAELGWIMGEYERLKSDLEKKAKQFDADWTEPLKAWADANPPEKGKTALKTLHGELKYRDQAESWAYDTAADPDKSLLKAQIRLIYQKDAELANKLGIKAVEDYTFEWPRVKEYAEAKGGLPGVKHTPYVKNKFSIGPTIDTFKDKVKDGLKP